MSQLKRTNRANIRDIADELGLSIGTVSRSLNNRYGVNPETRTKVLEAARRIGYVPNAAARQLKERPAHTIGLLFSPFYGPHHEVNPYATTLIESLKQASASDGLNIDVIDYRGLDDLNEQLRQSHPHVAVMLGHFEPAAYKAVHQHGLPSINLEYQSGLPKQVAIMADGELACETAVQYLAALGHERIALINGPHQSIRLAAYQQAFIDSMEEFHLPRRDDWTIELSPADANPDGAAAATQRILKDTDRPTAIVYGSDWLAMGGMQAIRDTGLKIGKDVSVIGYDNLPATAKLAPPLTTFDIHTPTVARTITRLSFELSQGSRPSGVDKNQTIYLTANLIKRQSCSCIRK